MGQSWSLSLRAWSPEVRHETVNVLEPGLALGGQAGTPLSSSAVLARAVVSERYASWFSVCAIYLAQSALGKMFSFGSQRAI